MALTQQLISGLEDVPRVTVYGGLDPTRQTATVSFNVCGMEPSDVGMRLDDEHEIMCRVGLHCAPAAHKTLGTFPSGTVRFAPGPFSTAEDVGRALQAVREITERG